MDKCVRIEEFMDYGGNELFSQLMTEGLQRSEGLERLIHLLKIYSDSCGRIKGRSAAYRYMLRKAYNNGWLGKGSKDLKSHRLTDSEREYIAKMLGEYISSGGRSRIFLKKILRIAAVIVAVGLLLFFLVRYFTSDEFKRISGSLPYCTAVKLPFGSDSPALLYVLR